jgi:Helix-turn-helix domain
MPLNLTRGPIVSLDLAPFDIKSESVESKQDQRPRAGHDCADCLLDVNGAAELLGVSAKWVYVNYKTLPHIPIGSGERPRLRFRRKALLEWIDRREIDWRQE